MAKVAFLVEDMFEDSEFRLPYDSVKQHGHQATIVGTAAGKKLEGYHGRETITTERGAADAKADAFDALVVPGGYSPDRLRTNAAAVALVRTMFEEGKPVAAVCHAGSMLVEADVVRGRTLTSWPSVRTDLVNAGARWLDCEVVVEGNLVTSRRPDDLPAFCDALARAIERGAVPPAARREHRVRPEHVALARIVAYLRARDVPFSLASRPSPEPLPAVASPTPRAALDVETRVLLVGGRPAVACLAQRSKASLPELVNELGTEVIEGSAGDLAQPYAKVNGPMPPLGGALGALTLVDAAVTMASTLRFMAFSNNDFIELCYGDLARIEQPRVASFALIGELPAHAGEEAGKKAA